MKCSLCQSYVPTKKGSDVILHSLPINLYERDRWLDVLRITHSSLINETHYFKICSRHFEKHCYHKVGNKVMLAKGSIPTILSERDLINARAELTYCPSQQDEVKDIELENMVPSCSTDHTSNSTTGFPGIYFEEDLNDVDPISINMPLNSGRPYSILKDCTIKKENNINEDNTTLECVYSIIKEEPCDIDTQLFEDTDSVAKISLKTPSTTSSSDVNESVTVRQIITKNISEQEINNEDKMKTTTKRYEIYGGNKLSEEQKYQLTTIPIVYTMRLNDMSFKKFQKVRKKETIQSIYKQSKPKFKFRNAPISTKNQYNTRKEIIDTGKNPRVARTYSRLKPKTKDISNNLAEQSPSLNLEKDKDLNATIEDSGLGANSAKNNVEQVNNYPHYVSPADNLIIDWFKTKINHIPTSSHTKLMSRILAHNPNLSGNINSSQKSVLLQSKKSEYEYENNIIELDRELDQMINTILDNPVVTKVKSENKLYDEKDDICCWYKREQLAVNAQSNVVSTPHSCAVSNCACCCKPKLEKLAIKSVPLNSRHTSKFNTPKINMQIEIKDSDPKTIHSSVQITKSNPITERKKKLTCPVNFTNPVINTLEALKYVNFNFNSEGKLEASLACPLNSCGTTVLNVLDKIFSVVTDQITARGFTARDKISIGLNDILYEDSVNIPSNTVKYTNKVTTTTCKEPVPSKPFIKVITPNTKVNISSTTAVSTNKETNEKLDQSTPTNKVTRTTCKEPVPSKPFINDITPNTKLNIPTAAVSTNKETSEKQDQSTPTNKVTRTTCKEPVPSKSFINDITPNTKLNIPTAAVSTNKETSEKQDQSTPTNKVTRTTCKEPVTSKPFINDITPNTKLNIPTAAVSTNKETSEKQDQSTPLYKPILPKVLNIVVTEDPSGNPDSDEIECTDESKTNKSIISENNFSVIANIASEKRQPYIDAFESFLRRDVIKDTNDVTITSIQSLPTIEIEDSDTDETVADNILNATNPTVKKRKLEAISVAHKIRILDADSINILTGEKSRRSKAKDIRSVYNVVNLCDTDNGDP